MKIFQTPFLLFILVFTSFTPTTSNYAVLGNTLTDLMETTTGTFGAGWTLSNYVSSPTKTSFCDAVLLMGGYNVLGGSSGASFTASYNGIPTPHNSLTFSITFWILDSWTNGDRFDLVFDLVTLTGWSFPATSASGNLCGVGTAGDISGITITGQVAHSGATLTFKVISQLSSTSSTKSFGFRGITFTFGQATTTFTNTMCAITPIQMPTTPTATAVNTCSCSSTQYEYPTRTGNCYACNSDCLYCTNSASTACTACKPGKYLDVTQCEPCDTSCATCSTGGADSCSSCNTGSYLVLSQYCVTATECSYPLIQVPGTSGSPDICKSPCTSTSVFIYWDQSCSSTCAPQLQEVYIGGLKLCTYPCLTSQYLYWDGTCQSSCNFPLSSSVQNQRNFCNFPCATNQYLQWDGTCQSSCPSYFIEVIQGSLRYCNRRCPIGQYYTPWDGNCVSSCDFPFSTEQYTCALPCDNPLDYYCPSNRTCVENCYTPFHIETFGYYSECVYPELDNFMAKVFLLAPLEEGTPTLVVLVRIMQYVRYLNISMSPRLERLALSKGRNIMYLNYGFNMPDDMREGFDMNPISSIFQQQGLHSQFFVNFWKDFIWILIVICAAILFRALEILSNRSEWKTLQSIFGTFRAIALWNFLIVFFATSIDDIILFSSIEFMSFYYSMDTTLEYLSFITCLVVLCLVIILVLYTLYILIKRAPAIQGGDAFIQEAAEFTSQHRTCSVLYLGFDARTVFGKFFFLIYMARLGLPMIFAMSLISQPLVNVFLQTVLGLGIIGCVIYFKPLKSQFNHFQLLLFEMIVLIMNVLMFIITVLKVYDIDSWNATIVLGDIVIAGNSVINLLVIVFAIFKIVNEIASISKLIGTKTLQQQISFLIQLLVAPLQQGSMGFECVFGLYSLYSALTELGVDADMIVKRKAPTIHNEEPKTSELVRLTNKQVRAKDFDASDLKSRLERTANANARGYLDGHYPYNANPLSLVTNISAESAVGQDRFNPLRGSSHANYDRDNSVDLPRVSMLNSSFIPLANREHNLSALNNNTSYDFGDSMFYGDPLNTNKGAKTSESIHFAPSSLPRKLI